MQQMKAIEELSLKQKSISPQIAKGNKFKGIGRNEWIKVKYSDGEIKHAKFKKLQKDLIEGNCTIIKT